MSHDTPNQLVEQAIAAAQNAHCPYSQFCVGAALLTRDGQVFTGANVENASYGLTICAERSAIAAAITAGARDFEAVAIVASGDNPPLPCGACRQVMAEFCKDDFTIHIATIASPDAITTYRLHSLLPNAFSLNMNT
jgi:cytidine deaminase